MNVGFRGTGEAGTWFEDQQAAALQSGDISQFGYTVEVAKLTGGVTEPADAGSRLLRARLHLRLHDRARRRPDRLRHGRRGRELRRHPGPRRPGCGCLRPGLPLRRPQSAVRDLRAERARAARDAARAARLLGEPHQPGRQREPLAGGIPAEHRRSAEPDHRRAARPRARGLLLRHLRARRARRDGRRRGELSRRPRARVLGRLLDGRLRHAALRDGLPGPLRGLHRLGRLSGRRLRPARHHALPDRRGRHSGRVAEEPARGRRRDALLAAPTSS